MSTCPNRQYISKESYNGKTLTGMIISIVGVTISVIGMFYSLTLTILGLSDADLFEVALGFCVALVFFSFPLSMIGLVLSKNGMHTMNKVGKILGIIGLAVSGLMLFLPAMVGMCSAYYYY